MTHRVGDMIEFRDEAGWHRVTVVQVSDMWGEYLVQHGNIQIWVSAHRTRTPEEAQS